MNGKSVFTTIRIALFFAALGGLVWTAMPATSADAQQGQAVGQQAAKNKEARAAPAAGAKKPRFSREMIERGQYLVTFGNCNDCHTPWVMEPDAGLPVPDMTRMLSGHPAGAPDPVAKPQAPSDMAVIGGTFTSFVLPFGIVYAANLTPDPDTGLGNWTEDMFVRAMRTGRHMGGEGRMILPPMPWQGIGQATDQDLKAIYAYLQSIPAIRNDVPAHKVPEQVVQDLDAAGERLARKMKQGAHGAPAK